MSFILFCNFSVESIERPDWAGFYTNSPKNVIDTKKYPFVKGLAGRIKWSDVEPQDSVYNWSTLDTPINAAVAGGFYYYFVFWVGPDCPTWIYGKGVSQIMTDFKGTSGPYPDYKNPLYIKYFNRMIGKLADHIASLSPAQRKVLGFIQPAFGSTGDQQMLKGNVVSPAGYTITDQQYADICTQGTLRYYEAFNKPELANIKFLFNIEDAGGTSTSGPQLFANWYRQNYTVDLRKQQFTVAVGYQANGEISQDNTQRPSFFGLTGKDPDFVRGEFSIYADGAIFKENLYWNYYWTAISTVDRGLDLWELDYSLVTTGLYNQGFDFSNKYSYFKRPETSPYAFVALRDVLDANDVSRFPVGQFGSSSKQSDTIRIRKIQQKYAIYGAKVGDMVSASTMVNAVYLANSKAMNDVGYELIARNYSRFITQIDANNTSVGWWRVGPTDQPYGRYARGFENASNKNRMSFDLDDNFFLNSPTNKSIEVKIIYLDSGTEQFSFRYNSSTDKDKIAQIFTKTDTKRWVEKIVKIDDGEFLNKGVNSSDFSLVNEDTEDDIFHLIEIKKALAISSVINHNEEKNSIVYDHRNSVLQWSNTSTIERIVVYDIAGKAVREYSTANLNTINISPLKSGMYVIRCFQNARAVINQKIIMY
ncbi:MAG: T9SS type A sorting domain-containing protein [Paludibacter sp.]